MNKLFAARLNVVSYSCKNSEEVKEAQQIKLSLLKWNKQQLGLWKRGKPGLANAAYPVMIAMKDLKCSTY